MLAYKCAPTVEAELHYCPEKLRFGDNLGTDVRFFDVVDEGRGRHSRRVMDIHHLSLGGIDLIGHIRYCRYDIHIELPEEALLDYFQMEQAEEAAAEARTEGQRRLGFVHEGSVIELELLKYRAQFFELGCIHGIHTGEDHRLHLLETRNSFAARAVPMCYSVTDLDFRGTLYS